MTIKKYGVSVVYIYLLFLPLRNFIRTKQPRTTINFAVRNDMELNDKKNAILTIHKMLFKI